jgi:alpha-galactosidase
MNPKTPNKKEVPMKSKILFVIVSLLGFLSPQFTYAAAPTPAELSHSRNWAAAKFEAAKDVKNFFSFTYDGKPSTELLKTWDLKQSDRKLDDNRTEFTRTYTDPTTKLVVRCVGIEYHDFPAVEWTVYFKNTGDKDTPIIADIQAIDENFVRETDAEFTLHSIVGDTCSPTSYQPYEETLGPKASKQIAPGGGRPTNGSFPCWNFASGGKGILVGLGWPGQWSAHFDRDEAKNLRIRAGQELTHFKLLPGEEVRTPLVTLQFYEGDWLRGQNLWRGWMLAHNLPRPGGKQITPQSAVCTGNSYPGLITNAAEESHFLRRYVEEKIVPNFWWQDAGWYPCGEPGNWGITGTWEVEPSRWPKGIREVSDWCKGKGIKTLVWFEPERVHPGTWLTENHPEWIFGGKAGGLLNLGDVKCREWLTDHIDKLMKEQGIDMYRQDFNIDPLGYWRGADAEDRQGIAENKHVQGYLAYWDALLERHPSMFIDSCASGGRRNDLETLRRAAPLLRSDHLFDTVGQQNHTYGLSLWIPYYGTGFLDFEPNLFRSQMSPWLTMGVDTRKKDLDYDVFRKLFAEWKQTSPLLLGDYYPLTPYSPASNVWMVCQFHDSKQDAGVIRAFRREECPYESIRLKLQGLKPDAVYVLTNLDTAEKTELPGRELLEKGLPIVLKDQPGTAVITYKKK